LKPASLLNAASLIAVLASAIEPWWKIEVKILILKLVYFTHFHIWGLDLLTPSEFKTFIWLSPEGIRNLISKLDVPFPEPNDVAQWLYLIAFLSFTLAIIVNILQVAIARDSKRLSYTSTLFYSVAVLSFLGAVNWFCSRLFIPLQGERYVPVHPHAAVSWSFGNGFFIALLALGLRTLLHVVELRGRSRTISATFIHSEAIPKDIIMSCS